MVANSPKLGQIAYIVNADGTLGRSFVSGLKKNNAFDIFNTGNLGKYAFDFLEAAEMSTDILLERKKTLEAELDKIKDMLRDNGSLDHQQEVDASKVTYPHNATSFLADKEASMPLVPESYIKPGELAYVVVTVRNTLFLRADYKAAPYSIVQVEVLAAALSAGQLGYETDIFMLAYPPTIFPDLSAAKQKLAEIHAKDVGGTLAFDQMKVVLHKEALAQKATSASGAYLTNELDSPAFLGD